MRAEWSSSLDTPDAVDLVHVLGALFGGDGLAQAGSIEAAMRGASPGEQDERTLHTEAGDLDLQWRAEDTTTTDVYVFGPDDAIAVVDAVFDPEDPGATSEGLYRHGVALWSGRRLDAARRVLDAAATFAGRDRFQAWSASIDRARALVALELDEPDVAEQHLGAFQPDPVSAFVHLAVQSRVELLRGDHELAAQTLSRGAAIVLALHLEEVPDLMNSAIGCTHASDALLELGYAASAARLAAFGQDLVARAGVDDPVVAAALALAAARSAGLAGDAETSIRLLGTVDTSLDPDLEVNARAEHARARWRAGDTDGARAGFEDAVELARGADLRSVARLLAAERDEPRPRTPREEPGPIETWAGGPIDTSAPTPYAVVLTLVVEGSLDRCYDLEDEVAALLDREPHLGAIDGTGSDGEIWELFLDGDDGPALWAAVQPLVHRLDPPAGSTVRVRGPDGDVLEQPVRP